MNEIIDTHGTPHLFDNDKQLQEIDWSKVLACKMNAVFKVMASAEGELFNPLSRPSSNSSRDRARGGEYFQLRKCSAECYRSYITFLRGKNRTHFVLAQRRFLDGFR